MEPPGPGTASQSPPGDGRPAHRGRCASGRGKERYPRVARYYELAYDAATRAVTWTEHADKNAKARDLDGTYVLKTDRQDLTDEEV